MPIHSKRKQRPKLTDFSVNLLQRCTNAPVVWGVMTKRSRNENTARSLLFVNNHTGQTCCSAESLEPSCWRLRVHQRKTVRRITSIVCSPWQKVSVFSGSMAKPPSPLSHSTDKTASPSAIPPNGLMPLPVSAARSGVARLLSRSILWMDLRKFTTQTAESSAAVCFSGRKMFHSQRRPGQSMMSCFFQPPRYLHRSAVCFDWPELPATATERLLWGSTQTSGNKWIKRIAKITALFHSDLSQPKSGDLNTLNLQ